MAATASSSQPHLSVTAFALMRTAVGVATLLVPTHAAAVFGVDTVDGSRIIFRLFGARELALGGMLWYSQRLAATTMAITKTNEANQQRDLKLVLLVGLAIDTIDMISSAVCFVEGSMGTKALWLVGAGAGVFAALGGVGLVAVG